jgi:hypothetical protein
MRKLKIQFHNERTTTRRYVINFCICVVLMLSALAGAGYAQAGRRVQPPKNDPPVPKAAEPAAVVKKEQPEAAQISLLVGSYTTPMRQLPHGADDLLQGAVVQRLRDSKSLKLGVEESMTRGEANKRAKAETEAYILWLELKSDRMDFDPTGMRNAHTEDLYIQYVVLEPKTGKVKTQGNVQLRPTSSGRIGGIGIGRSLPRCYPQPAYSVEFAVIEAGIEAAERVFHAFSLGKPPLCS